MPDQTRIQSLSRHNLWILRSIMGTIRTAISEGTLWEIVEQSAMANPSMHSAVVHLKDHIDYIERHAPRSTRRFMCSSDLSLARPEFARVGHDISERFPERGYDLFLSDPRKAHQPWAGKRAAEAISSGLNVAVACILGIAPYEIVETYPFSQLVCAEPSDLPPMLSERYSRAMYSLGRDVLELGSFSGPEVANPDLVDALRVAFIARMQFGLSGGIPSDAMLFGLWDDPAELSRKLSLVRSRKTGKIRNVMIERTGGKPEHILSLRAEDGLFSLKWGGALRLHAGSKGPFWRVVVEDGTGEFNEKGFNVFNKFVLECDPRIRSGDEVLVVGSDDRLHAVGKAIVDARTMTEARAGTAVKVREGREKVERPPE